MPLPLTTRGSQVGHYWPSKDCLNKCFAVASNPEAADYMAEQFSKKLQRLPKLSDANDTFLLMSEKIKEYARNVHLQYDARDNPWDGIFNIKTDFQNLQKNLTESILKNMPANIKESVKMDFALSDDADLLRAFSVNGQSIDQAISDKMDALLNACLAENNLISKNGTVYDADEKGNINQDAQGNDIRASAKRVRQIILELFPLFLKEKGMNMTAEQQQWPKQESPAVSQVTTKERDNQVINSAVRAASPNDEAPSVSATTPGGN